MTGALVDVNVPAVFAIAVSNAVSWNIIDCDAQPITVASTATDTSLGTDDIVMLRLDLTTATEGADTNTSTSFSLATVPFPSTTCFNWTPDASLSTATTYSIAFSALDSLGKVMSVDYSHWFSLSSGESAPDATYCDCEDDEDGSMGAESPSPANKKMGIEMSRGIMKMREIQGGFVYI
ncbi:hypothetical protein HDU82_006737 [Entophlyctis luteolus]|nr:hypothetical protein HDU82_006737 [Entophlyctis luteolus]